MKKKTTSPNPRKVKTAAKKARSRPSSQVPPSGLEALQPKSAFVDVGSGEHWVCVPKELCQDNVKRFEAYTDQLRAIRDWLLELGVKTVAMESTGVYWINLHQILEDAGLQVGVVNARDLKYVKGRPKTDKLDCQWGQRLLACGLLRNSFRPAQSICEIRAIYRMRSQRVEDASRALQRMNKALCEMNLLLRKVVSDIVGVTGTAIIEAIIAGERDPRKLAESRDHRIRKSRTEIARALDGDFREEQVFLLEQAYKQYRFLVEGLREYDQAIAKRLEALPARKQLAQEDKSANRKLVLRAAQKTDKAPAIDTITLSHQICGVDISRIPGIGAGLCLALLVETGADMAKWPTRKHFCSWLGLSPNPRKSAGKDLGTRTKKCASQAANSFRQAAASVSRSESCLGEFFRRIKARKGGAEAIAATAHKIAAIYYSTIAKQQEYAEPDKTKYLQTLKQRRLRNLRKQARKLGVTILEEPKAA